MQRSCPRPSRRLAAVQSPRRPSCRAGPPCSRLLLLSLALPPPPRARRRRRRRRRFRPAFFVEAFLLSDAYIATNEPASLAKPRKSPAGRSAALPSPPSSLTSSPRLGSQPFSSHTPRSLFPADSPARHDHAVLLLCREASSPPRARSRCSGLRLLDCSLRLSVLLLPPEDSEQSVAPPPPPPSPSPSPPSPPPPPLPSSAFFLLLRLRSRQCRPQCRPRLALRARPCVAAAARQWWRRRRGNASRRGGVGV